MSRTDPQVNFRLPAELRDRLAANALGNNRSLSGELIARLEWSFRNIDPQEASPHAVREPIPSSTAAYHLSRNVLALDISIEELAKAIAIEIKKAT